MKVDTLIRVLQTLNPQAEIYVAKDAEINAIRPLEGFDYGFPQRDRHGNLEGIVPADEKQIKLANAVLLIPAH